MTNRRELLQLGLAVAALPVGVAAGPLAAIDYVPLYKALYDLRFPASVAFAAEVAARGVAVAPMTGDMTRFWYDDLYHRWKVGPVAITGLTGFGALFCLEQLAMAERMRVIFRARHSSAAPDRVDHAIEGPAAVTRSLEATASASDWPSALAHAVTRCPRGSASASATARSLRSAVPVSAAEPLYSWVIAPVVRAASHA